MDLENKIFIIDRCDYTVTAFFIAKIAGCKVEDDCLLLIDGKQYSINKKEPFGIETQRDLQFYTLEEFCNES